MDGEPRTFPERSQSVPRKFPERSQSPAGPLIPHHVLIKWWRTPPPQFSLTSCCNLGFSQRWDPCTCTSVHLSICLQPPSPNAPVQPNNLLPARPPSELRCSRCISRPLMIPRKLPTSKLPVSALELNRRMCTCPHSHVAHTCALTRTCV